MVVNSAVLLTGLEEYHRRLREHISQMEQQYQQLEKRWQAFSAVYEGNAAEQFRTGWRRTTEGFRGYVDQGHNIMKVLEERIEALREANRAEGYM
ncbi:MAG: WXG100 family type VII secretion target [Ktedonobacteraceae bacterium]|jgi:uncharacterized protein YukE